MNTRPHPVRVVQWATGTTGRLALRAVIEDPELELVGVRVYDPEKVGKDAGALAVPGIIDLADATGFVGGFVGRLT